MWNVSVECHLHPSPQRLCHLLGEEWPSSKLWKRYPLALVLQTAPCLVQPPTPFLCKHKLATPSPLKLLSSAHPHNPATSSWYFLTSESCPAGTCRLIATEQTLHGQHASAPHDWAAMLRHLPVLCTRHRTREQGSSGYYAQTVLWSQARYTVWCN